MIISVRSLSERLDILEEEAKCNMSKSTQDLFRINLKDIYERLDKLEIQPETELDDSFDKNLLVEMVTGINKLKEYHVRQIDENRHVGRVLDELECHQKGCDETWCKSNNKIEELESKFEHQFIKNKAFFYELKKLKEKIGYVEKKVDVLYEKVEVINALYSPCRNPNKCPVCVGMGGFVSTEPNECPACDGKGIVWG